MVTAEETVLTARQVEVLELREQGYTQQEVADRIGTTDANVSAIERSAETNIEKARRTVELARTLRAPVRFSVPAGLTFEELVDEVYERGDDADIPVAYERPELHTVLYETLESYAMGDRLETPVDIGLTADGNIEVFPESS